VGFEAVDSALRFAADPAARRQTLVGGVDLISLGQEVVLRLPGAVILFPWFPQLRSADPQPLPIPGSLELAEGWGLQVQRIDVAPEGLSTLLAGDQRREAFIDPLKLEGSLIVRPPLPGDRIRPLGMQGSVKLADLFVHRSVPWPARERWPVLADDRSVIWVAGLHLSRRHCLTPESSQAVTMRLQVQHRGHARWTQSKG
jgi:tRNA(Ile)-lysidine synthetase-like protein